MEGQFRDVSDLARQAIELLRATDPRDVRAARPGTCAAVTIENGSRRGSIRKAIRR